MTKVQILSRRGAESIFEGDNGLYLVQLTPQFNLPGLQGLLFSSITRILHLWRITAMVRRKPVPIVFPPFAHFLLNLILSLFSVQQQQIWWVMFRVGVVLTEQTGVWPLHSASQSVTTPPNWRISLTKRKAWCHYKRSSRALPPHSLCKETSERQRAKGE